MSALFKEMLEVLSNNVTILSKEDSNKIIDLFESKVPIYSGGSKIDWREIKKHISIESENNIIPTLNRLLNNSMASDIVYVFWNNAALPVVQIDLQSIIKNFDDVISVGIETWLYNPEHKYVIECMCTGYATIGLLE